MLQPSLAAQVKPSLQGNKNKTGSFDGEYMNMEEWGNDSASTPQKVVDDNKTFDVMVNDQSGNGTHVISDMHKEPHLAPLINCTLEGNKNENGSLDGSQVHVRNKHQKNCLDNFNITAETCDQVTTDNLDLLLAQNYDDNISSTIECDTMATHEQKNFINVMNNEPQRFVFCPLTPLESYKDEPVHWDVCPTDLEAHSLVTATGKPNFLAARIPVDSQLNISNWPSHLSDYWDVQVPDLLEYGFPLAVDRGTLLTSETNHTSTLQNSQHVQSYIQE